MNKINIQSLSKSKLMAFRQCPKRLWLEVHHPDLREDTAATKASFQVGFQVGDIAHQIYDPEAQGVVIDIKTDGFNRAFERSAELLHSAKPIFEAGFSAGGALAFADVMLPDDEDGIRAWRMVEVKSSTCVKEYHRDDVAVQAYVVKSAGVLLKSISLAHIDNTWIYPGNDDYQGLLKESDLTTEAFSRSEEVKGWINQAQKIVSTSNEPAISVGGHCDTPFACGFYEYCCRNEPKSEHPIDWLPRFNSTKKSELASLGIYELKDVPDEVLNAKQKMVKNSTLTISVYFDKVGAAADLSNHYLPAYFLDFETI